MTEDRLWYTKRLLDPSRNPPQYVDEELPTVTVKFQGAVARARTRAPRGTILGSYRVTGSFYETGKGTHSLRITRVSLFSGSRSNAWMIRHSRQGTTDVVEFDSPGQYTAVGQPTAPLYSFGPGTVSWGWVGDIGGGIGSAYDLSQTLEGVLG